MTHPPHVAWTGGSRPLEPALVSQDEWDYAKKLFIEQMDEWRAYWREEFVPVGVRNTFWGRARYDAHATYRARNAA